MTFKLAHLSDLHLSSPRGAPLGALLNKRALGYLSWRIKRKAEHRVETLNALVANMRHAAPDHVAITGDLTHIGLPREFAQVAAWLGSLGPPSWVTVVPGNHDTYVRSPWEETFAQWTPYLATDGVDGSAAGSAGMPFPSVRRRGPLALIGVSTAFPSPPFAAVGEVGAEQAEALERALIEAREAGLFRVVLMHHPPLAGIVSWRRRLMDGARVCSILERAGAELVLHGHAHRTSIEVLPARAGEIPVIGARSASEFGRRAGRHAQYHLYRIEREAGGWRIDLSIHGLEADGASLARQRDETIHVTRQ